MAVFLLADGRFQRNRLLGNLQDLTHPLHRHVHLLRDLLRSRFPSQLLQKLSAHTDQLVDRLHHVHRNTDRPRLIRNGSGDGLTDPPCGVGGEFITLAVIKLFNRLDQTQISLLDQIQKQHAAADIALGDADHQTQVSLGQTLLRILVAVLHALRQLDFLLCGQKRHLADLLQVHAHRILDADAVRNGKVDILHIHLVLLRQKDLLIRNVVLFAGDAQHIHTALLQQLQQLVKLLLIQLHIRKVVVYLLVFQNVLLFSRDRDQTAHPLKELRLCRRPLLRSHLGDGSLLSFFRFFLCLFTHLYVHPSCACYYCYP